MGILYFVVINKKFDLNFNSNYFNQGCKSPQSPHPWGEVILKSPQFFWGEVRWFWNHLKNFEVRWGDFIFTSKFLRWGEVILKSPHFFWGEVRWFEITSKFFGVRWGDFGITSIFDGVRWGEVIFDEDFSKNCGSRVEKQLQICLFFIFEMRWGEVILKSPHIFLGWGEVILKSPQKFWGEVRWFYFHLKIFEVRWGDFQITSIFLRWGEVVWKQPR